MQDGKAIKMLATASRLDIEDFLQKKVYLEVTSSSLVMWLLWTLPSPAAMLPSWRSFYLTSNAGLLPCTDRGQSEGKLAARRAASEAVWLRRRDPSTVTSTPGGCAITVSCREHRMTSLFLSISSLMLLLAMRVSIAVSEALLSTSSVL